jgi:hypothetical protein
MKEVLYGKEKLIPVVDSVDVLVVGGGPGGLGASVMAAQNNCKTLLAERFGSLGGMAFHGEVNPFMYNHLDKKSLDRPVFISWCEKMVQYYSVAELERVPFDATYGSTLLSKDFAMLAMEDLVLESNCRILFHHVLADVIKEDDTIRYAVFQTKSGLCAVESKIFIDSTGDGDLAYLAGCNYEMGNQKGNCQPMSSCFKMSHIDMTRIPDKKTINELLEKAKEADEIHCPRENVLYFTSINENTLHFNTTRIVKKSAVNAQDLSEAEIEGRRQIREFIRFFRKWVPGFENASLHSIASTVGVRESRRIRGKVYQTVEDFHNCAKYPDGIARCNYPLDIHNPDGAGDVCVKIPKTEYYEIRYGALLPENCPNLLMGCRAISVDHALHSSIRVMPPMCSIGQAAGMGAALAIKNGVYPSEIDGKEVRNELIKRGAYL